MRRAYLAPLMFSLLAGCGASHDAVRVGKPVVAEAYYSLRIGGEQESGRDHKYVIRMMGYDEHTRLNSLYLADKKLPLDLEKPGVWVAWQHFEPGQQPPRGLLQGRVEGRQDTAFLSWEADSIYLKEELAYP